MFCPEIQALLLGDYVTCYKASLSEFLISTLVIKDTSYF